MVNKELVEIKNKIKGLTNLLININSVNCNGYTGESIRGVAREFKKLDRDIQTNLETDIWERFYAKKLNGVTA